MAGRSFLEALEDKYADSNVSTSGQIFLMNNMDVAGEIGKIRVPREMSLNQCDVTHAGDLVKIGEICCKVSCLDLAKNNITDWSEILKLLSCMPNVTFLNVSENNLGAFPPSASGDTFPSVTKLALNSTSVGMDTVSKFLRLLPSVEELHLCMNGYTSVDFPGVFPSVTSLYLNGNKISDFGEILKLDSVFPNLQQLLLIDNPISRLGEQEDLTSAFKCLSCINVSGSNISSWQELEKFKHFPTLTDIRIKSLPLYEELEEKLRRQLIIGYLPRITRLNLSDVSTSERETAERIFMRQFLDKEEKPERFAELHQKHGEVHQFADVVFKPEVMKTVEIHFEDKISVTTVDTTKTVGALRKRFAREFAGRESREVRLFHESPVLACGPLQLRYMQIVLHSIPIENGDKFYMDLNNIYLKKK